MYLFSERVYKVYESSYSDISYKDWVYNDSEIVKLINFICFIRQCKETYLIIRMENISLEVKVVEIIRIGENSSENCLPSDVINADKLKSMGTRKITCR